MNRTEMQLNKKISSLKKDLKVFCVMCRTFSALDSLIYIYIYIYYIFHNCARAVVETQVPKVSQTQKNGFPGRPLCSGSMQVYLIEHK